MDRWLKMRRTGCCNERDSELSASKLGFLGLLNSWYHLKKASGLWNWFVTIFNEYDSEGMLYYKW